MWRKNRQWMPDAHNIRRPNSASNQSRERASLFNEVRALEYFAGEINRVPVSCDHESGETFPIGKTVVTCTAIGTEVEPGQRYTTQESFTITVVEELPAAAAAAGAEEEEEPPTTDTGGQQT